MDFDTEGAGGLPPRPAPRLAVTADLHWGVRAAGDAATVALRDRLAADPPDVLVLAGDVGAGDDFGRCLDLFAGLPARKVLVSGNHDVWVTADDARGDSWRVYAEHLPAECTRRGFQYLDRGPLVLPEYDLAIVGSMNWYDYSWSLDRLKAAAPDWEERLRTKRFTRGRHNDARFVRWDFDDAGFTRLAVAAFARHLDEALNQVGRAVVVTHHPPVRGLNVPPPAGEPSLDRLLWEAFSGNRAMEELLERHAARIPLMFCGHTHRPRETDFHGSRGFNVGGDYDGKRLLTCDGPDGTIRALSFTEEGMVQ